MKKVLCLTIAMLVILSGCQSNSINGLTISEEATPTAIHPTSDEFQRVSEFIDSVIGQIMPEEFEDFSTQLDSTWVLDAALREAIRLYEEGNYRELDNVFRNFQFAGGSIPLDTFHGIFYQLFNHETQSQRNLPLAFYSEEFGSYIFQSGFWRKLLYVDTENVYVSDSIFYVDVIFYTLPDNWKTFHSHFIDYLYLYNTQGHPISRFTDFGIRTNEDYELLRDGITSMSDYLQRGRFILQEVEGTLEIVSFNFTNQPIERNIFPDILRERVLSYNNYDDLESRVESYLRRTIVSGSPGSFEDISQVSPHWFLDSAVLGAGNDPRQAYFEHYYTEYEDWRNVGGFIAHASEVEAVAELLFGPNITLQHGYTGLLVTFVPNLNYYVGLGMSMPIRHRFVIDQISVSDDLITVSVYHFRFSELEAYPNRMEPGHIGIYNYTDGWDELGMVPFNDEDILAFVRGNRDDFLHIVYTIVERDGMLFLTSANVSD